MAFESILFENGRWGDSSNFVGNTLLSSVFTVRRCFSSVERGRYRTLQECPVGILISEMRFQR